MTLLAIHELRVSFGPVRAVKSISFDVPEGSSVALVGESGSGKSVTALSIMGLLPPESATATGRILYKGQELDPRRVRGSEIAMIFQEPMTSLNPVFSAGFQIGEVLRKHLGVRGRALRERVAELLDEVGLPPARADAHPFQLSGGQQQRVMIAMALTCEPRLLIADEPTTALDVTIQRQILELIARLQERHRMSVLFISHDLGVVGEIADHVVVMRQGVVREQGAVARIFQAPQDAYTKALLACRPSVGHGNARLTVIDDHIEGKMPTRQAKPKDPNAPVVLQVRSLAKSFFLREGLFGKREFKAVRDVNFQLRRGHTLGVVGESGSGKTTMGLTLLRLHEPTAGEVVFDGRNLLSLTDSERQAMRRRIQIVFQNP